MGGLVLVEAQHENEAPRLDAPTGGGYSKIMGTILDGDKQCLAGAEQGFVPGASHGIHIEKPDAVVKAVNRVLDTQ